LPFYWTTLKTTLIILICANVAIDFIVAVAKADALGAFVTFWGSIWGTALIAFAIVTIVFALLERYKPEDGIIKWDPRTLPAVVADRIPRFQSALELSINGLFALWLSGTPMIRELAQSTPLGPGIEYLGGLPFSLPWLHRLVVALFFAAVLQAALNAVNLVRPDWFRLRAWVLTVTSAFLFIVVASILSSGLWTVVTPGPGSSHVADIMDTAKILNWVAVGTLAAACLGFVLTVALNIRYLFPPRRREALNLRASEGH
jgi:hypothetical protein